MEVLLSSCFAQETTPQYEELFLAPTRHLERASRSGSGHRRGGGADTYTTRCPKLAHG